MRTLGRRGLKLAGQAAVMVALVLGLVAFVGTNKQIVVTVDGHASSVQTFGSTVEDALKAAEVQVDAQDQVTPALSAAVDHGSRVEVQTAKEVRVSLNGAERTVHTTGSTVGDLVHELGVAGRAEVSKPSTMTLASTGTHVAISTPKEVQVLVDGQSRSLETTALRVGALLAEAKVELGADDRVSAPLTTPVIDGMAVKVTRMDKSGTETVEESIPFETVTEEDPDLYADQRKVLTEGSAGTRVLTYALVSIDGEQTGRSLLTDKVSVEPVTEKVAVGTKERPEPEPDEAAASGGTTAAGPASGAWQALAECESGGDWSINSGNGYYGGLQFSLNSWLGAGGGKYAGYPHQATPAEQIATAEVLKQSGGWGHWPSCSAKLGLR